MLKDCMHTMISSVKAVSLIRVYNCKGKKVYKDIIPKC